MSRVAWFHAEQGAAGDMLLGALIAAGAPQQQLKADLALLNLEGWELHVKASSRAGVSALHAVVESTEQPARTWREIDGLLAKTPWPERVIERSRAVFARLAEVEAAIHGVALEDVHFHEVGAIDSIVDIAGVMLCLEYLNIDHVWCSALGVSSGSVATDHGVLPALAPATAQLLDAMKIRPQNYEREILTPTAAAIFSVIATQSFASTPLSIISTGLGAGTWDPADHANVVQVVIGSHDDHAEEVVVVLETVVDDLTGEHLGHVLSELIAFKVLDAWATPVAMKKGRLGQEITVICEPLVSEAVESRLLELTGSLGCRRSLVSRSVLSRDFADVQVFGHAVRMKIGPSRVKPEFEDLAAVARLTGHTLYEVEAEALAAWRTHIAP